MRSDDPLTFFDLRPYAERLAEAELNTGLGEAMVIGQATIDRHPVELAVMDFAFMGGSMGSAVGEKFSRACDSAIERGVPMLTVTSSGGARMQEGILSLMQLPKTVCAVEDLHDARLPLITVMAHPTTAGVLASFASLGDVTIAEPGALIAFTGPRVVQQTTKERLPDDFGLAEQNLRFGHVDAIVPRGEQRAYLTRSGSAARSSTGANELGGPGAQPAAAAVGALPAAAAARCARVRRGGAAPAPARPPADRHERRGDLALGRARAAPGPAVHARLRLAHPRRLGRAARRSRPRRRRRARHRAREAGRPHDRVDRAPEGPRREGAYRPAIRDGVPGGVREGDARDGDRRAVRLSARSRSSTRQARIRESPRSSTAREVRSRGHRRRCRV